MLPRLNQETSPENSFIPLHTRPSTVYSSSIWITATNILYHMDIQSINIRKNNFTPCEIISQFQTMSRQCHNHGAVPSTILRILKRNEDR